MAKNYKGFAYFDSRPDIVKIFTDLEAFYDFCRFELLKFDEADLYNRSSYEWRSFEKSKRPKKPWTGERKPFNKDRKPYVKKQYNA